MITIKEIAEEAGVTATTVSNVLHGKINKVSPQMVEKIQHLLAEHRYIPRFGLSALTSRESRMIGVLINTPEFVEETLYEKPFYGSVIGALESLFRQQGYYIMVFSSKNLDEIMRMTLGWNVDGVISISMPRKYCQKLGEVTGKPVVSIDMDVNDEKEARDSYNVTSPDYDAGEMMVQYLTGKGITEIVYAANVKRGADYRRYQGAAAAYQSCGGEQKELDMVILERTFDGRRKQYKELERLVGKNAALFFSSDLNAAEAVGCFTREGIRIPQDLSIVGTDDDIFARLSVPRLTTVRAVSTRKAELAAEMLLNIIEGRPVPEKNAEIAAELIERESVNIRVQEE